MTALAVIPARYASVRFPGKPLVRETGKFLIQHVVERVLAARRVARVLVATDDARIADAVRSFGGAVAMTRADHASGTDRIAEVLEALGPDAGEIVLNVQGDEPEIDPADLDRLVERLERERDLPAATLACAFREDADPGDPNAVKVVTDLAGRALYFSRARIPYPRGDGGAGRCLLHLGVYAYRRGFVAEFAGWPASELERVERLEQLRILEHGRPIGVEVVERASIGVDTPEDYRRFVERWRAQTGALDTRQHSAG